MRRLLLAVVLISGLNSYATRLGAQCDAGLRNSNVRPFSSQGSYVHDYDIIRFLPIYNEVLSRHVEWASRITGLNPVFVDAGGGTGNMALAIKAMRPDGKVFLLDLNEAMLNFAKQKGFPGENIGVCDITNMMIGGHAIADASVDHILSHSVLWALKDPSLFFVESHRVLKRGGTLAISTSDHPTPELMDGFIKYLDEHLLIAERQGFVSAAQRENFVNSNKGLISVLNSPLSRAELIALGVQNGFEVVEAHGAYIVPTVSGHRPLFNQVLFRKL